MTASGFMKFLESRGIFPNSVPSLNIVDSILSIKQEGIPAFLFLGVPGSGKTKVAEILAEYLGASALFYQFTPGTSEEELLYRYIPSEETRSGFKISLGVLPRAVEVSRTKKVVLILDEFDKSRPTADSFLLDFLQNGRVTLYLDDNETVIKANKDNLIVVLTSNNFRELSEPLMRRLVKVVFYPPRIKDVYNILKTRFNNDKVIALGLKIYATAIKVNDKLRKPVTIQEIIQLLQLISAGTDLTLEELLQSIVFKYDEDYQLFKDEFDPNEEVVLDEMEKPKEEGLKIDQIAIVEKRASNAADQDTVQPTSVSELLRRIKVAVPHIEEIPKRAEQVKEEVEVTAKVEYSPDTYSDMIKAIKAVPTETPTRFISRNQVPFEVVNDEVEGTKIISKTPLTYNDMLNIINNIVYGEYYFEDKGYMTKAEWDRFLNKLLNSDRRLKIKYYTSNKIALEYDKGMYGRLAVVIERSSLKVAVVDGKEFPYYEVKIRGNVVIKGNEFLTKDEGVGIPLLVYNGGRRLLSYIPLRLEKNYGKDEVDKLINDVKQIVDLLKQSGKEPPVKIAESWSNPSYRLVVSTYCSYDEDSEGCYDFTITVYDNTYDEREKRASELKQKLKEFGINI